MEPRARDEEQEIDERIPEMVPEEDGLDQDGDDGSEIEGLDEVDR